MQSCMHNIQVYIWIHKVGKIFTNAKNVILHVWSKKFEGAFGNAQTNATVASMHSIKQETWGRRWKCTVGKAKLMQPMRLYVYSDPSTLRTHLKRYSGEKSNKCNQCDFASSRAGDLRRHLKTNLGEKSNKCNQCDFASTQAGNLKWHLKIHSGEKSSKCNQLRQGPSVTWKKASRLGNLTIWLCPFSCRQFEDTFENAQWRKVK